VISLSKRYAIIFISGDARKVNGAVKSLENKKLDHVFAFQGPIEEEKEVANKVVKLVNEILEKRIEKEEK